tara:strand:- start:565 stop:852 length:288 start_codon:yes stop_codon:yes gene_type:complete
MARKDRRFGFEGGNIVPFSRGKYGVSSSFPSSPSETNQRAIASNPIMIVGALGVGSEIQKHTKKVMIKDYNKSVDNLLSVLEDFGSAIDNNSDIS